MAELEILYRHLVDGDDRTIIRVNQRIVSILRVIHGARLFSLEGIRFP